MYAHIIDEMVKSLQVAGLIDDDKDLKKKATDILGDYWTTKIGIIWDVDDVLNQAREHGRLLTEQDAIDVLSNLKYNHDASIGINWDTIDYYVLDYPKDPNNPNPYGDDDDDKDDKDDNNEFENRPHEDEEATGCHEC